jgi:hypothetical protein
MLIVIMLVGGLVSCLVAANKQRNAVGWFCIGALFPLLGIILAVSLPPGGDPSPKQLP